MTTQSGITTKMITNNANDWCYCVLSVTTENYKNKQCQHELQLFIDEVVDLDDNTPLTLNSVYEIPIVLLTHMKIVTKKHMKQIVNNVDSQMYLNIH